MPLFISDGYTLDGTIKGRGRLYPTLKFRYRPATSERVQEYLGESTGQSGSGGAAKVHAAKIKLVGEHLVEWSAADDKDQPVAITPQALKALWFDVLNQLVDHITGYAGEEEEASLGN